MLGKGVPDSAVRRGRGEVVAFHACGLLEFRSDDGGEGIVGGIDGRCVGEEMFEYVDAWSSGQIMIELVLQFVDSFPII